MNIIFYLSSFLFHLSSDSTDSIQNICSANSVTSLVYKGVLIHRNFLTREKRSKRCKTCASKVVSINLKIIFTTKIVLRTKTRNLPIYMALTHTYTRTRGNYMS